MRRYRCFDQYLRNGSQDRQSILVRETSCRIARATLASCTLAWCEFRGAPLSLGYRAQAWRRWSAVQFITTARCITSKIVRVSHEHQIGNTWQKPTICE